MNEGGYFTTKPTEMILLSGSAPLYQTHQSASGGLCLGIDSQHFRLLHRTGTAPIATVMRRLLTGYAVSFNRRHRRHGQVFQNRYKSILCQEDPYLLELVRYIHLNPLRAKIVTDLKDLDRYSYCGHSALMGKKKRQWMRIFPGNID
ncbi:MAG: hypothetical protein U9R02_09840 [Thermodesulfobacteriota bacterium]|nr:hypothetical protein [Thermodesulfobacteriota bacterium]